MSNADANRGALDSISSTDVALAAPLVHVTDHHVFHALACNAVRVASQTTGPWLVYADSSTIHNFDNLGRLLEEGDRLILFGETPPPPTLPCRIEVRPAEDAAGLGDHFFLIAGAQFHFGIHGSALQSDDPDLADFEGAWTASPEYVTHCARQLTGETLPAVPENPCQMAPIRLAALHVETLTAGRRHIARDKADLFSVLDILKTISTKRRAHDVLYVFVEHIARVVPGMRRCSVVRVWGGRQYGQVLASHEDKHLQEHSIHLEKYPEILETMRTGNTLNIPHVSEHQLTAPYAPELEKARISSLLVIPVVLFDEEIGSLLLRAARSSGAFMPREVSFCQIAAEAASSALERAQLFDNIQRANERLARLAKTDGLTGLYNYRHFRDRLEEEFARALRYSLPLSCMIFDVDDFKRINDSHGHIAGDAVLRAIAQRTLRSIRTLDIVARYGGEEFAIIMPQTNLAGAKIEAERVRAAIADCSVEVAPRTHVNVKVSVGLAALDDTRMASTDALVHAADEALYQAKRGGKDRVVAH